MYHSFCALCGVVISPYEDPLPPSDPLSWASEARAVRLPPPDSNTPLSGVGIVDETTFRAIFDPAVSYVDHFDALEDHDLCQRPEPNAYLFHDACWKLLTSRLSGTRGGGQVIDAQRLAISLFHLFRCLPKDRHGALLTSHDHGGCARFRQSFGLGRNGYERSLPDDWLFLLADPGPEITILLLASIDTPSTSLPVPPSYALDAAYYPQPGESEADPFRRLPPELLGLLLTTLSSADACRLRLASDAVARVSSPLSLSQSFWESRFAGGFEMGFFFPDLPSPAQSKNMDWRTLYAAIRTSLSAGPFSTRLRNRRRIWNCLAHVVCPLEPLLCASNRHLLPEVFPPAIDSLPENQRCGDAVQSHAKHHYATRYLSLRGPSEASRLRISVFFIEFNCRRYVSGAALRYRQENDFTTSQHVGIRTATEEHIDLDTGDYVDGMKVYSAADGIVGLWFSLSSGISKDTSLGHCLASCSEIAVAELLPAEPGILCGLMLTVDACKCTQLALVESAQASQKLQATEAEKNTPDVHQPSRPILWKPNSWNGKEVTPLSTPHPPPNPPSEGSPVRLNMVFGGVRGEKLPLLNRIVALFDKFQGLFKGFRFYYDDGTSTVYGTPFSVDTTYPKPCTEMSFVVYGKQGERLTEIRALHGPIYKRELIRGLTFLTNWGSECSFVAFQKHSPVDASRPFATFKSTRGSVLTGLIAELTTLDGAPSFHGVFGAVGAWDALDVCPAREVKTCPLLPTAIPILGCHLELPPHITRQEGGCFTSTSLKDVCRIRFSAGVAGCPRSQGCLSGLYLQFRNRGRDNIVGQWFKEVDIMDIDDGDFVSRIRVWYSQDANPMNTLRENNGKIVGIMLSTSKGAVKTVLCSDLEAMLCHDYYSNPLEQIHGLIWSFSSNFDHLEVLRSPPRYSVKPLQFETRSPLEPRDIHDLRRLLWTELDGDGNEVSLTTIEAWYNEERSLTGLRFVYADDTEATVGSFLGERVATSLGVSEVVVAVDVGITSGLGDVLMLHTNQQTGLSLHHPSVEVAVMGEYITRYILTSAPAPLPQIGEEAGGADIHVHRPRNSVGRCVGIWAMTRTFPRAAPGIRNLGPVFT